MWAPRTSEPTFEKIEMEETRKTEKEKDRDRDICIILCIQFASFSLFSCIRILRMSVSVAFVVFLLWLFGHV